MNTPIVLVTVLLLFRLVTSNDHSGKLIRSKRYLVFPSGGTFKIVLGFAIPVKLGSKQNMGIGWNFQFQYMLPTNITMLESFQILSRKHRDIAINDRSAAYLGLEAILNSNGLAGRQCLLRSICENAQSSLHHPSNGLYGQLLHILLTPDYGREDSNNTSVESDYYDSEKAGKFGVDCNSLYPECSGYGLLDMFSIMDI